MPPGASSSKPSCTLQPNEYGQAASIILTVVSDSSLASYAADEIVSIGKIKPVDVYAMRDKMPLAGCHKSLQLPSSSVEEQYF